MIDHPLLRQVPAPAILAFCAIAGLSPPLLARPDQPKAGELWQYEPGAKVESYASPGGAFRLHFVRTGAHAVPGADLDDSGVPDRVEKLALTWDEALAFYQQAGFLTPVADGSAGGDARFDIYLLDFAGMGDGNFVQEACTGDACSGYMVQENDYLGYGYPSVGYADRILSSHELFHASQAAYDAKQSSIIGEGTAVWATERFDHSLEDFEAFVPGYFEHPDRSLDKPMVGPVDAFSYGTAIFFRYLEERLEPDAVRRLWEDCRNGAEGEADPQWFKALGMLLARDYATTFADEFATFATWNALTGPLADPARSYAHGADYPAVASTSAELPYRDDELRVFYASSQYLRFDPQGRTAVSAALAPSTDASSLRLALVARTGSKLGAWQWLPLPSAAPLPVLEVGEADEILVLAVNTAQSGESVRGSLCVGSPAEVAPCLPAAPGPQAEVGGADVGGPGEDISPTEAGGSGLSPAAGSERSGGCQAAPGPSGGWWLLLALALFGWKRRCRRVPSTPGAAEARTALSQGRNWRRATCPPGLP